MKPFHELNTEPMATVIQISLDNSPHKGWSKDHFGLPTADIFVFADPDQTAKAVLAITEDKKRASLWPCADPTSEIDRCYNNVSNNRDIFMSDIADATYAAVPPEYICL